MRLFWAATLFAALSFSQDVRLGEAIQGEPSGKAAAGRSASADAAVPSTWYDTSNREAVAAGYRNDYLPLKGTPLGWTGNLANGVAGDTSTTYKSAVAQAINWFRAMAGVPADITIDLELSRKAQLGALMLGANQQLAHNAPTSWLFYTADGATALQSSNICQGFTSDPGCVELYMLDHGSHNGAAGHRRWILNPPTRAMGTGDVLGGYNLWNALWVFPAANLPERTTRSEFVAWPPAGFVPYQMVFARWSFAIHGADFSNSTVTMTKNGASIPVQIEYRNGYYGDPAIVWVPENRDTNSTASLPAPAADVVYAVSIANVRVGTQTRSFQYNVVMFDPSTALTFSFNPQAVDAGSTGGAYSAQLTVSPAQTAWSATSSASWVRITQGASGSGSGTVRYTVDPNTGAARTATIQAGSAVHTVRQAAAASACTYALGQASMNVLATGGTGAVGLTTSCTWTASSNRSWAQVYPLNGSGGGNIQVTVYPNYATQARTATLTIAGQSVTVSQPGAAGTPDERFVGQLYFSFFGRVPSPSEVAFQVQNALQRGVSRADLAMRFYASEEFNLAGRFVAGLYVGLLARDAEYGGWLFQRNAFATGIVTQTSLVGGFLNSAEFLSKNGSLSDAALVQLLYQQILGRSASAGDVAFQTAAINAGMSRIDFGVNMLNSAEFRANAGPRLTAFLLYAALLNRGPSGADLQIRADQVAAGVPVVSLVDAFLRSPEFSALVN